MIAAGIKTIDCIPEEDIVDLLEAVLRSKPMCVCVSVCVCLSVHFTYILIYQIG